jgi:hypothetical protein
VTIYYLESGKRFYSLNWKPDIKGKYIVIAKFVGTESYWPSQAVTAFAVDQVPPQQTEQPVASVPPTDMYVLGMGIAIIIAIVMLRILLLRKRPYKTTNQQTSLSLFSKSKKFLK